MADWLGSRIGRFFARYVDWGTWGEGEEFWQVTGGRIELSSTNDLKATGSLDFYGVAPDESRLLRIYYTFEDELGETETVPVATMFAEASKDTRTDASSRGTANLKSVLKVLSDRKHGAAMQVPAGTDAVGKAKELCESVGLKVSGASNGYALSQDHTFSDYDSDYLTVVNWLLEQAGFFPATPNALGYVVFEPYREPSEREPSFTFAPGPRSVMLPEVLYESGWQSCPNAVRLGFSTDTEAIAAWALNVDPNSKSSLPSRGNREVTLYESVSELAGNTVEEREANLKALARTRLLEASSEVERVEVGCPFLPVTPNQSIEVDYAVSNWTGGVVNVTANLGNDADCVITAKRFVRRDIQVESGSEVLWNV